MVTVLVGFALAAMLAAGVTRIMHTAFQGQTAVNQSGEHVTLMNQLNTFLYNNKSCMQTFAGLPLGSTTFTPISIKNSTGAVVMKAGQQNYGLSITSIVARSNISTTNVYTADVQLTTTKLTGAAGQTFVDNFVVNLVSLDGVTLSDCLFGPSATWQMKNYQNFALNFLALPAGNFQLRLGTPNYTATWPGRAGITYIQNANLLKVCTDNWKNCPRYMTNTKDFVATGNKWFLSAYSGLGSFSCNQGSALFVTVTGPGYPTDSVRFAVGNITGSTGLENSVTMPPYLLDVVVGSTYTIGAEFDAQKDGTPGYTYPDSPGGCGAWAYNPTIFLQEYLQTK